MKQDFYFIMNLVSVNVDQMNVYVTEQKNETVMNVSMSVNN